MSLASLNNLIVALLFSLAISTLAVHGDKFEGRHAELILSAFRQTCGRIFANNFTALANIRRYNFTITCDSLPGVGCLARTDGSKILIALSHPPPRGVNNDAIRVRLRPYAILLRRENLFRVYTLLKRWADNRRYPVAECKHQIGRAHV